MRTPVLDSSRQGAPRRWVSHTRRRAEPRLAPGTNWTVRAARLLLPLGERSCRGESMASRILIVGCAREGAELERRGHCLAHVVDARALPQWLADPEGWDVALRPPDLALLHSLHTA